MKLRTIHHLACSGGTIISKAIQAMKDTLVLSEIHPDSVYYRFNPFDPTQLLLAQTTLGQNRALKHRIFIHRIKECASLASAAGATLVLRDHTHYDYTVQPTVAPASALLDVLSPHYELCSLVTVRHPLEAYMSLKANGWDKGVKDLNDYCLRFDTMVSHYQERGAAFLRYEDFCANPHAFMRKVCQHLELTYNPDFERIIFDIPMTGDSGRGKAFREIKVLTPKAIPAEIATRATHSKHYLRLAELFGYPTQFT